METMLTERLDAREFYMFSLSLSRKLRLHKTGHIVLPYGAQSWPLCEIGTFISIALDSILEDLIFEVLWDSAL